VSKKRICRGWPEWSEEGRVLWHRRIDSEWRTARFLDDRMCVAHIDHVLEALLKAGEVERRGDEWRAISKPFEVAYVEIGYRDVVAEAEARRGRVDPPPRL